MNLQNYFIVMVLLCIIGGFLCTVPKSGFCSIVAGTVFLTEVIMILVNLRLYLPKND